jgi:hypothetical protein
MEEAWASGSTMDLEGYVLRGRADGNAWVSYGDSIYVREPSSCSATAFVDIHDAVSVAFQ